LKDDQEVLEELRRASSGLLYMSESDYPFELVRWDGDTEITPDFLRSITGESADCPIEENNSNTFLGGRYQQLSNLLKANLSDLKVYKVGRINMPVYVVGRSPEGNWLGLSTRIVQT
jgi:hypothetical protein